MARVKRDLLKDLARNISGAIEESETPTKVIASTCGVSESTLSQWRNGKRTPTIKNIERLSECLGISPCRFFRLDMDTCPNGE